MVKSYSIDTHKNVYSFYEGKFQKSQENYEHEEITEYKDEKNKDNFLLDYTSNFLNDSLHFKIYERI